jgi:hypothetical protein
MPPDAEDHTATGGAYRFSGFFAPLAPSADGTGDEPFAAVDLYLRVVVDWQARAELDDGRLTMHRAELVLSESSQERGLPAEEVLPSANGGRWSQTLICILDRDRLI